jgi:rubrerythrin
MAAKAGRRTPAPPIQNRADLIQALTVASQLEHGLMLMYLYTAFSMKCNVEELRNEKQPPDLLQDKLRNWKGMILRVARQEMEHLGFVCNMLSAIGGNTYFDRPNFPQTAQFWPTKLPIQLEKFGVEALLNFLAYEKPENLVDTELDQAMPKAKLLASPQPKEPKFESLGELYKQIRTAFATLPEDQLFLVPKDSQVDNDTLFGSGSMSKPTYDMYIFKVWDRQSAINAVDEIIEQGEGTLTDKPVEVKDLDPNCHYMQFRQILKDYLGGSFAGTPTFQGARNCVLNPAFELHQDTCNWPVFPDPNVQGKQIQPRLSVAIINHKWSRDMMGIVNTAYESLMQMLVRLYTASDDTPSEVNGIVQTAFFPMMTMAIRPLSELMSLLPAFKEKEYAGYTAGAGFEYFRTIGFLPHKPAAWITIYERLQENADAFARATKAIPPDVEKALMDAGYRPEETLPFIRENLKRIPSNFKTYLNF